MAENPVATSDVFRKIYDQWYDAINTKNWSFFEDMVAEDYNLSFHAFPGVAMNREQFLESERKIAMIRAETIDVHVHTIGKTTVTIWVIRMHEERLSGAPVTSGVEFTDPEDYGDYVSGTTMVLMHSWRNVDGKWKLFDHHVLGPAE